MTDVSAAVRELSSRGFRALLAHPERSEVLSDPAALASLVDAGARVQVNAASLLGELGGPARTAALRLLDSRLVHVVASDAHGVGRRLGAYLSLVDRIARNDATLAADLAAAVSTTPRRIVAGLDIDAPRPVIRHPTRKWLAGRRSG
jgi:protein-tyrosine phosphatase